MVFFKDRNEIINALDGIVGGSPDDDIAIFDDVKLKETLIDGLVYSYVFHSDSGIKNYLSILIKKIGNLSGVYSSSIQKFYEAIGKGEIKGLTVPAINIRGLTFDVASAVFKAAIKKNSGALIFEIARSEIGYTNQRPEEYSTVITAAAIKEGYKGPLFFQGDHFQVNAKKYAADPDAEVNAVKKLIDEAVKGDFYNIDIDASTLVDLSKETLKEQQHLNSFITAELTDYIRSVEPKETTVSVGGEIGEVGKKNSTVEELEAFMDGYREYLKSSKGISKISVQTGTTHGGVALPDGTIAKVKLDFETLQNLSKVAREKYGMSGAVQHGASTLPDEAFGKFPETSCSEIHLATGFQNMIYDSPVFPSFFKKEIYDYLAINMASERKEGQTDEQFYYNTRKKGFGPFKQKFWNLEESVKASIRAELQAKFEFLFEKLNAVNTKGLIEKYYG